MITLRCFFRIALAAFAVATGAAQENAATTNDLAQLQGEWIMVSGERDGQPFPAAFLIGSKRLAKGNDTTVMIQGQIFLKAKFSIDPTKSPKTIDYAVTEGTHAGKTQLGIYKLSGNTVTFCFSTPGKDRPTEFATLPNDGRTLAAWKRNPSSP